MTPTIVIGAGIAGLATAWRLSVRGRGPITVLDREALAFSHSSARNAAIFRPLETSVAAVRLVARSAQLFGELDAADRLVRRVGLCLTASSPDALEGLRGVASEQAVEHEPLSQGRLSERCPATVGGRATRGLWLPGGGVLDIHHLSELLRREGRRGGVTYRLNAEVATITVEGNRVSGVELTSGERLNAGRVVIAAGAWAGTLGAGAGAPLRLTPHRRHLALLMPTTNERLASTHPVVWNVQSGVYFRPESGGVLACPGDHQPAAPGVPHVDEQVLATLAEQLPLESPVFESHAMARPWACLRTMSDSKETVLGPDPRIPGLFWLAGLGGHGMSAGVGAADCLASAIASEPLPSWINPLLVPAHLKRALAPDRLEANEGA